MPIAEYGLVEALLAICILQALFGRRPRVLS